MKYVKAFIAFVVFAIVGALFGFALHWAFEQIYPPGLRIDLWGVIIMLIFFSAFFFFVMMMLVDIVELICTPVRIFGGSYKIIGTAAIAEYLFFCVWSVYDLWVVDYKFQFTSMDNMEWKKFTMAVLMTFITIVCFGICITAAWGPKDQSKRKSS